MENILVLVKSYLMYKYKSSINTITFLEEHEKYVIIAFLIFLRSTTVPIVQTWPSNVIWKAPDSEGKME